MQVKQCMKQTVFTINPKTTTAEAASILASKHIGSLPVIDQQGKLVGLLQLRDLLLLVLPDFLELVDDFDFAPNFGAIEERKLSEADLACTVDKLMRPPISVEAESGLLRAFSLLYKHQLHDLPVVDEDNVLVGIVSHVDVGTAFLANWHMTQGGSE